MSKSYSLPRFLAVFTALLLIAGGYFLWHRSNAAPADPQDAAEIQAVITRSYDLYRTALRNGGDVSEFPQVFTNTRDYRVPRGEALDFVRQVLGSEAARQAGYLSAMQAKYKAYGAAVEQYRELKQQADQESREITAQEWHALQDANFGMLPPIIEDPADELPPLTFESMIVRGDRAVVVYKDEAATLQAILVRQDGQWRIASVEALEVTF